MFEGQTAAFDPRWKEYDADEWSDALVASMKLGGVEHIFFVSGAEIAFYQESVAKAQARGWPTPKRSRQNLGPICSMTLLAPLWPALPPSKRSWTRPG